MMIEVPRDLPKQTPRFVDLLSMAWPDLTTADVIVASLSDCLRHNRDAAAVLRYFESIGMPVRQLDDLLTISSKSDEEELFSRRVVEGVAITIGSDGTWVLFRP
ncbi:hypothetical protein [Sphingomonas carotinifaciens]|uniref:hypothetical protein n=1 Tax=Sphingomonas carotinifaciens TaxID=1166323 RepID=UPI0012379D2A|nr:hypothetical protein [Sphingomonas carotinifaciens]